jgi:hypothetical protein
MKKRYKILLGITCFFTLNLTCKLLTKDFDLQNIVSPVSSGSIAHHPEHDPSVKSILNQPFRYLARGHQSFVFASEDGEYVLKLFVPHYAKLVVFGIGFHFTLLPLMKSTYNYFGKNTQKEHLEKDFESYVNAFRFFKDETLTEHVHLEKTTCLNEKIRLFDKIGVAHTLDADNTCFLIQKKADLIGNSLKNLSIEDARTVLTNLLLLLQKREDLKFDRPTHKFHSNFGCLGLNPIQFDIGRILIKDEVDSPSKMGSSLLKLQRWLNKTSPSLLPVLEEARISIGFPEADTAL